MKEVKRMNKEIEQQIETIIKSKKNYLVVGDCNRGMTTLANIPENTLSGRGNNK